MDTQDEAVKETKDMSEQVGEFKEKKKKTKEVQVEFNSTTKALMQWVFVIGCIIALLMSKGSTFKGAVRSITTFVKGLGVVSEEVENRSMLPGGFDYQGEDTLELLGIE